MRLNKITAVTMKFAIVLSKLRMVEYNPKYPYRESDFICRLGEYWAGQAYYNSMKYKSGYGIN